MKHLIALPLCLAALSLSACGLRGDLERPDPMWGNPNEPDAFDYMMSYSPYDNLEAKDYPATLVTTSFNDSQVMYWEPAKYVAKLRTLKTDDNELLLKCKLEAAGHGGASGRYDRWKDRAFEVAWMLNQVGIDR